MMNIIYGFYFEDDAWDNFWIFLIYGLIVLQEKDLWLVLIQKMLFEMDQYSFPVIQLMISDCHWGLSNNFHWATLT